MGIEFKDNITENPKIKSIQKVHNFFEEYALIENAPVMQSRFDHQIKKIE